MSDYDEAVKKGAIRVPGYNPPGGSVAAEQQRQEKLEQMKKDSGGGSGGSGGGCFVATAAFGDYNAPEVVILRTFRDRVLSQSTLGRGCIQTYYTLSPPLAKVIEKSESLRTIVRRFFLQPVIFLLRHVGRNQV